MKNEILLELKRNSNKYVSGQKLCEKMNISRTSIWKYIKKLQEEGYKIQGLSNKGYKLIETPDILTSEELQPYLSTKFIGRDIEYYDSVTSTNDEIKAQSDRQEGFIVISEEQTLGKGRLGRKWISKPNKGIYFSILLKPNIEPKDASKVTQIAAASLIKGLEENKIKTCIKWPNDIIMNNKKIVGILTEMTCELLKIDYIVLGIGINVNLDKEDIDEEIKDKSSSIKIELGKKQDRKKLIASILNCFEEFYLDFIESKNIDKSLEICRKNSILLGKKIKVIQGKKELEKTALDIGENGELIVKGEDGNIEKVFSGEVSIRGINGYI